MKILVAGFQKTGTTSLETALLMLGYTVGRPEKQLLPALRADNFDEVWKVADRFDALQDNPWPLIYNEFDERYPGSKFILTLRDPEPWLRSMINHCGGKENDMRKWIYGEAHGTPKGSEEVYKERLVRHQEEVIAYFKDRPEDLLIFDVTKADGWEKLCAFLGCDVPDRPFPHSNHREYSLLSKCLRLIGIKPKHRAWKP